MFKIPVRALLLYNTSKLKIVNFKKENRDCKKTAEIR